MIWSDFGKNRLICCGRILALLVSGENMNSDELFERIDRYGRAANVVMSDDKRDKSWDHLKISELAGYLQLRDFEAVVGNDIKVTEKSPKQMFPVLGGRVVECRRVDLPDGVRRYVSQNLDGSPIGFEQRLMAGARDVSELARAGKVGEAAGLLQRVLIEDVNDIDHCPSWTRKALTEAAEECKPGLRGLQVVIVGQTLGLKGWEE